MRRKTSSPSHNKARRRSAASSSYNGFIRPHRRLLAGLAMCAVLALALYAVFRPGAQSPAQTPDGNMSAVDHPSALPPTPSDAEDVAGTTPTDTPPADTPPHDTAYHFDEDGLLLYDTYGHYVQADSYSAAGDIPWQLLLVNDWNPMIAGYDEGLTLSSFNGQQVDGRIADAMQKMLSDGSDYGLTLVSGFRAASLQRTLYWNKVAQYTAQGYNDLDAQLSGGKVVKRPGFSEHNTGLAADMGGSGNFSLEEDFADTEAYAWLIDHCADYGFILRFPQGKEDITGVIYEPWHYRYVGVDAAREIMSQGLCLEEYLEQLGK